MSQKETCPICFDTGIKIVKNKARPCDCINQDSPKSQLNKEDGFEKHYFKAQTQLRNAQAVFWLLNRFYEFGWDGSRNIEREIMYQNLFFVTSIGLRFLDETDDSIDRMQLTRREGEPE